MNRNGWIAVGALAGLVVGASFVWWMAHRPPPFVPAPASRKHSTAGEPLVACKPFSKIDHPTRIIVIYLPGAFDPTNLMPTIKQYAVVDQEPWTDPDTAKPLNPPVEPKWYPRSKLDLNLQLVDAPTGNYVDKVLIRLDIADPKVKFRDDEFPISGGDRWGSGHKDMFCKPTTATYQSNSVTFMARYFNANGPNANMGAYNVGLFSGDGNPYQQAFVLDPDVMNNGIDKGGHMPPPPPP